MNCEVTKFIDASKLLMGCKELKKDLRTLDEWTKQNHSHIFVDGLWFYDRQQTCYYLKEASE